jgi:hypothetical protein
MKRTIPQIIANKILDHIELQSLGDIFFRSALLIIAIIATLAVLYPATAQSIAQAVNEWHNSAIPKTAFIFALVFNFQRIARLAHTIYKNRPVAEKTPTGDTIEGIPTVELLDHLFEHQSFKRDDIEGKFGIPRNRYTLLAIKLEKIGVLIRGDSNSRILNPDYSRADIAAILASSENARDLQAVFREVAPGSFTREPTGRGIVDRVIEAVQAPSPRRFPLHKLEN